MQIFFIGILLILLGGVVPLLFRKEHKTFIMTLISSLGLIICGLFAFYPILDVSFLSYTISSFNPIFGEIRFSIDLVSAIFIGIITIMGFIGLIYSNGYLKHYIRTKSLNSHLIFLTTLLASMLMVVVCQNALMFLICWEIMSLSSFFLVVFENEKKETIKAGIKYLVFMHISVLFIIFAFAILSIKAGSFDFLAFKEILQNNTCLANIVFFLAFAGFATKAGFVPFHNWLPDAHPAAPTHVSALMSGVMIKTGIYGILRMLTLVGIPSKVVAYIVLSLALISALYGILYAISQKDLKKLLAYSSIENIGIIGIGIGVGMLGLAYKYEPMALLGCIGAILHCINHSVFKTLMFFGAGNIYLQTHTKNIEELGGLMKIMPKTGVLFLIGSVAISGLPPFNGFVGEFIIYASMIVDLGSKNFFIVLMLLFGISILALVGTMAIICFSKAFSSIFLGLPRSEKANADLSEVSKWNLFPMSILALFIIVIGSIPTILFAHIPSNPFDKIIGLNNLRQNFDTELFIQALSFMQIIAFVSIIFVVFLLLLVLLKCVSAKGKIAQYNTWGCGYNRGNNRMQYSASSFVSPFLAMFMPLFKKVYDVEKPRQLFPKSAHYSMYTEDVEEAYIINPIVKFDEWFLSKFETLQSGNIQSYIKYSLIFLLLIILGSLFIG